MPVSRVNAMLFTFPKTNTCINTIPQYNMLKQKFPQNHTKNNAKPHHLKPLRSLTKENKDMTLSWHILVGVK